ncbi:T9SS type A sorting domain-containing protein [Larkinella terrae]|uniref:T9SS type A sorting domain-containing protein n=2 Tax=Larkinella terrae TaxID=2025311 RepID=A0A7K0EW02_9BACT|nr:T9SS type A sorting domain-containing protein [Larkinella terrae]
MRKQLFFSRNTIICRINAKRFWLVLPMLVLIAGNALAQTTWTGASSTAWNDPGNWSAGVPDATDDVIIPDVTNDPVVSTTDAVGKSVHIEPNGLLTINASGKLTINGSAMYTAPFDFTAGLNNQGTVDNSGNLTLGETASVGMFAIINQGGFTNKTGGQIHIDRSTDTGIYNASGTFTNEAAITIGATETVGLHGIWNDATFTNTSGTLQIDRSSRRAMMNNADESKSISASFTNSATITIGASATVGSEGIENRGTFSNNAGGVITIDRTSENGLYHASGTFTNAADLTIGATESVGTNGLSSWNTFNNNAGSRIRIDRATAFGLLHASGTFTNAASIVIGGVAGGGVTGLENRATFNNQSGGVIQIDRISNLGFHHFSGTFTNDAAITIGATESVGRYGFWNRGTFNNNAAGDIRIDHVIPQSGERRPTGFTHSSGDFTNAGDITIGGVANPGEVGLLSQATFTNNSDGDIRIDRTTMTALETSGGSFVNAASITVGAVAAVGQYGLALSGPISNTLGGHIRVDRTTEAALYNRSSFSNAGQITIGASTTVGQYGIENQGNFRNSTGGKIAIDRSSYIAIVVLSGTFNNDAAITIGGVAGVGTYGISNQKIFNNNAGGKIIIDRTADTGIYQLKDTFTNSATITIGASETVGVHGIFNESTFLNNAGGDIHIDRTTTAAVRNFKGTFTNEAVITLGAVAGIGTYGLYNQAVFNNNAGGAIRIDRSTDTGLFNPTGDVANAADITIGASASVGAYGLQNNGNFNNQTGGHVRIDRSTDTGLYHAGGSFTNTAGITIGASGNVGGHGIFNGSTFSNATGGDIQIDRATLAGLRNFTGSFTNAAGITIGATASVGSYGIYNQTVFTNQSGGEITINNAASGVYLQANTFANAGTVTIGASQNVTTLLTQEGAGNFSNNANGTFKGTGTIAASTFTNAGGTVSPGYSPGKLTFAESKDFTNSILAIEVNGTATAGVNFDQVVVNGTATLGGTLSLSVAYAPANGDEVTILTAQTVSGTFSSVTGLPANWTVVYTANSVKLIYVGVNPAPSLSGFAASSAAICVGNPVTFTATVGNVSGSYSYTLTNGSTSVTGSGSSNPFSQTLAVSGSGAQSFTLTINADGQSATAVSGLTVQELPTATISPSSATLTCASPSVSLTASGGNSYRWDDNSTNAIRTVTSATTYSVTVINGNGCSASTTVLVSGNATAPPVPNLTSTTVAQGSTTVTLTASNCTGTLSWTGPGGTSGTGSIVVLTGTTGTFVYQATCTVNSCTSEPASVTVVVTAQTVSGSFDGFIYGADCSTFRGWVWDRNKPTTAITVDILDGSTVLTTLLADQFRQDLLDAGKGNGKHAFSWSIPDELKDGEPHSLSARVTGNGFLLKDSPKTLICQVNPSGGNKPPKAPTPTVLVAPVVAQVGVPFSATLVAFTDPEGSTLSYGLTGLPDDLGLQLTNRVISGTPTRAGTFVLTYRATDDQGASNSVSFNLTVNPAETTVTGNFDGYLDKLDCGGIRGWVWDRNKPNTPLTVEFYLETSPGTVTVLGSTLANIYRQDLKDAGKGNGVHAYNFSPPGSVTNGTMVYARVQGSTFQLKGSPKGYQCAPARLSAEEKPALQVVVLGNPIVRNVVEFEIRGAEGQPVQLQLTDASGRLVSTRQINAAKAIDRQTLSVENQSAGLLFLRVVSDQNRVTLKIQQP